MGSRSSKDPKTYDPVRVGPISTNPGQQVRIADPAIGQPERSRDSPWSPTLRSKLAKIWANPIGSCVRSTQGEACGDPIGSSVIVTCCLGSNTWGTQSSPLTRPDQVCSCSMQFLLILDIRPMIAIFNWVDPLCGLTRNCLK